MFTGNIEVHCEDTAFRIDATYWKDLEVDYSKIEFLEYRQDFDVGVRTSGFGSARLKMGTFQNDEFIGMKDLSINFSKDGSPYNRKNRPGRIFDFGSWEIGHCVFRESMLSYNIGF